MESLKPRANGLFLPIGDDQRKQGWLEAEYSASRWLIGRGQRDQPVFIDFDYPLGTTNLLNVPELYRTVKEFSFWVRKNDTTRHIGAETHQDIVFQMLHICSAMAKRHIWDFAELTPLHVKKVLADARAGADRLIGASDHIQKALSNINDWKQFREKFITGRKFERLRFIEACNLPPLVTTLPEVKAVFDEFSDKHNLYYKKSETELSRNDTKSVYTGYQLVFEKLFALRLLTEANTLAFNPISVDQHKAQHVKKATAIPPPTLVFHLTRQSSEFVVREGASIAQRYRQHMSGEVFEGKELRDLYDDVMCLVAAVWFLIAIYTMRRPGEVLRVTRGSLYQTSDGHWWIGIPIFKNRNRNPWVPVPLSVVEAIRFLESLEMSTDELSDQSLFVFANVLSGRLMRPNIYAALSKFLKRFAQSEIGEWPFEPRQTRRFSSVLYFYKEHGSEESLATILGHFSLATTRGYTKNDPEVAKLWSDTEWGYIGEIVRSVSSDLNQFGGAAAQHIRKLVQRLTDLFRRKVRVFHHEDVERATAFVLERQGVLLTINAWADCLCPTSETGAKSANCREIAGNKDNSLGPDMRYAAPSVCAGCRWACHHARQRAYVDHLIAEEETIHGDATTVLQVFQREKIMKLQRARPSMEPV